MRIKQLLGIFYPESTKMTPLSYVFQYDKAECERNGYVWFEGYCFEVLKQNLIEIKMKREYIGGGKAIYNVYAILEVE